MPPLAASNHPGLAPKPPVNDPLLVAEQFAFHQRFRKRAAVDRDERLILAMAQIVYVAGNQFFPCSGFTDDEHACVAGRDHAYLVQQRE